MGKQALKYGTGLIALYLGVAYASGAGRLMTDGAAGGSRIIASFQGRGRPGGR